MSQICYPLGIIDTVQYYVYNFLEILFFQLEVIRYHKSSSFWVVADYCSLWANFDFFFFDGFVIIIHGNNTDYLLGQIHIESEKIHLGVPVNLA